MPIRPESNTVPIEKGTETKSENHETLSSFDQSNTVPIEKGTETRKQPNADRLRIQSNTVPIEKGTETTMSWGRCLPKRTKQHRPHREGD